jgi:thioredoxin-like negative regulator of GroEL
MKLLICWGLRCWWGEGMTKWTLTFVLAAAFGLPARAAENLKLNQHLDYSSDSQDGPLITGDHLEDGVVAGKPTYVIVYGEGCFNSKRQARRTVDLYEKYKGRVQFVVVDLDKPRSPAQQDLVKRFYQGSIPHVVVLNREGKIAYNAPGEVAESEISKVLDKTLR